MTSSSVSVSSVSANDNDNYECECETEPFEARFRVREVRDGLATTHSKRVVVFASSAKAAEESVRECVAYSDACASEAEGISVYSEILSLNIAPLPE